ncbi:hypothetical protein ACFV6E_13575 [Streptomyces sp. NPDC059785]|uniref:hypothetical protein n=1 Tax=unclassified Streptomyces TaxID=2593676 RepID=UPI00366739CE
MSTTTASGPKNTTKQEAHRRAAKGQQPHESAEGLHVHTVHAQLPIPYFTPGDMSANMRTVASWIPTRPAPETVLLCGGLGVLAAVGALEWPVALAIGGTAAVVRGRGREQRAPEEHQKSRTKKS